MTPPTGKSCFVFVFALRACVTRREISVVSRHVFVPSPSPSPAAAPPAAASWRHFVLKIRSHFLVLILVLPKISLGKTHDFFTFLRFSFDFRIEAF